MKLGTRTWTKRRWTPKTGEIFSLLLPKVDSECFQIFLYEFSKEVKSEVILFLDNSGSHRSEGIEVPKNIKLEYLPPYSPELNPCERVFEEIRRELSNKVYEELKELEEDLIMV